ncbi:hypothetical protein JB92DRAFT_2907027, partial [Gautieria morchelliformis]
QCCSSSKTDKSGACRCGCGCGLSQVKPKSDSSHKESNFEVLPLPPSGVSTNLDLLTDIL